ncbi:hypothetical protein BX265_7020 [Streptomyces sp. TLI_235]|nr:hypothetical protein BX265_7020 [Streptomyces sp. TLI_235]
MDPAGPRGDLGRRQKQRNPRTLRVHQLIAPLLPDRGLPRGAAVDVAALLTQLAAIPPPSPRWSPCRPRPTRRHRATAPGRHQLPAHRGAARRARRPAPAVRRGPGRTARDGGRPARRPADPLPARPPVPTWSSSTRAARSSAATATNPRSSADAQTSRPIRSRPCTGKYDSRPTTRSGPAGARLQHSACAPWAPAGQESGTRHGQACGSGSPPVCQASPADHRRGRLSTPTASTDCQSSGTRPCDGLAATSPDQEGLDGRGIFGHSDHDQRAVNTYWRRLSRSYRVHVPDGREGRA